MIWRNDDASLDTNMAKIREIQSVFEKHGLKELYSVTPFGKTDVLWDHNPPQMSLDELSEVVGHELIHGEIVDFLKEALTKGHQIALHGCNHIRISDELTRDEILERLTVGKRALEDIFDIEIKYYVAPFNNISDNTRSVCEELGMELLDGTSELLFNRIIDNNTINTQVCQYHYYELYMGGRSPELLDKYLEEHFDNNRNTSV
jgi:peptidoglycan/xylan/chitin deacetylase (PgdA/CDA1 family)